MLSYRVAKYMAKTAKNIVAATKPYSSVWVEVDAMSSGVGASVLSWSGPCQFPPLRVLK